MTMAHGADIKPDDTTRKCRLCDGNVRLYGKQAVLGRHRVSYFKCDSCLGLQTEQPFWLDEAYASHAPNFDAGGCERNLELVLHCAGLLAELKFAPNATFLDFGAGSGLFARMMRDRGFDFRGYDKFADCRFNYGFNVAEPSEIEPAAITAFEVFEHFVNPADEIGALLAAGPEALFFTTGIFQDQGMDWPYLMADEGQHVFFFSEKALASIAGERYRLLGTGVVLTFFSRKALEERRIGGLDVEGLFAKIRNDPGRWMTHCLQRFADHLGDPWKHVQRDFSKLIASARLKSSR